MSSDQNNITGNRTAQELSSEEASVKRKYFLALAENERQQGIDPAAEVDEADSTLATLILPGG